jgi:uncharacterized protein YbjT (DUF2867 family)
VKIVVIGGTGLIGTKLVAKLREDGRDAVAASPQTGVNVITGDGLAEALGDVHVVVDVTNAPSFEDAAALEFFQTAGRNLLAAEARGGVRHHVALSIVGIDRSVGSGYFVAKLAQEKAIKQSSVPYTIVRSTQFFEFMGGIAGAGEPVNISPALVQPIAADDVVTALAAIAAATPLNDTIEIAGPESMPLDRIVALCLAAQHDDRTVVADVHAKYFGLELDDWTLRPLGEARLAHTRFQEWVSRSR